MVAAMQRGEGQQDIAREETECEERLGGNER